MRLSIFYLFLICSAKSVSAQIISFAGPYDLSGKISQYTGAVVYWYYLNDSLVKVESIPVKNDSFFIRGLESKGRLVIRLNAPSNSIDFLTGSAKMSLFIKLDSVIRGGQKFYNLTDYELTGSEPEEKYQSLLKQLRSFKKLSQTEKADSIYHYLLLFSKDNPGETYVADFLIDWDLLNYIQARKILEAFSVSQIERAKRKGVDAYLERLQKTEIGKTFQFFPQKDTSGISVKDLSKLEFEYLFVDFWSSSCGPCRAEHPELIKIYNKYKSAGLEMLGISLDYSRSAWINAINKDKVSWINVSDLQGPQNKIASFYSINYIPFNLLLTSNMEIVAKNLSPQELEVFLSSSINYHQ